MTKEEIQAAFSQIKDGEFIKLVKDPDGTIAIGETATSYSICLSCTYIRIGGQPVDIRLEIEKTTNKLITDI